MATLEDVDRLASGFPDVTVGTRYGNRTWSVGRTAFAWERPFSKADLKRFGDEEPPTGPIVAIAAADLHEKAAILSAHRHSCFTISHFDNYPAVLVRVEAATPNELRELLEDGWLVGAPAAVARAYLAGR
ncbi:MAG: hypothetical protein WBQ44_13665 [Rhodococcus sp. (in: high G+C Gram-positive bacteria)]